MTFIPLSLLFSCGNCFKVCREKHKTIFFNLEKTNVFFFFPFSSSIQYIPIESWHLNGTRDSRGQPRMLTKRMDFELLRIAVLLVCCLSFLFIPQLEACSLHCCRVIFPSLLFFHNYAGQPRTRRRSAALSCFPGWCTRAAAMEQSAETPYAR